MPRMYDMVGIVADAVVTAWRAQTTLIHILFSTAGARARWFDRVVVVNKLFYRTFHLKQQTFFEQPEVEAPALSGDGGNCRNNQNIYIEFWNKNMSYSIGCVACFWFLLLRMLLCFFKTFIRHVYLYFSSYPLI